MEYFQAQKLKEDWERMPCDHRFLEKVYYAGAFLVNYSCTQCGADFTIAQKLEIDEMRKKKNGFQS
jgi:hydrogenase maturation factor HypF (carbamoyltransferase family)